MSYFVNPKSFPICIPEVGSPPNPSNFPVGISLSRLFRWYYSARIWTISAPTNSITASAGDTNATCPFFSIDTTEFGVTSSETQFACIRKNAGGSGGVQDSDGPDLTGSCRVLFDLAFGLFFGSNIAVKYNGLYYPSFNISVSASASGTDISDTKSIIFSCPDSPAGASLSFFMDGIAFSIEGSLQTVGSGSGISLNNNPGSYPVTIAPISFWPFDPGDGNGPIFDSATGEQLRDNVYQTEEGVWKTISR